MCKTVLITRGSVFLLAVRFSLKVGQTAIQNARTFIFHLFSVSIRPVKNCSVKNWSKIGFRSSLVECLTSFTPVTKVLWSGALSLPLSYICPLVMTKLGPKRFVHKFVGYIRKSGVWQKDKQ